MSVWKIENHDERGRLVAGLRDSAELMHEAVAQMPSRSDDPAAGLDPSGFLLEAFEARPHVPAAQHPWERNEHHEIPSPGPQRRRRPAEQPPGGRRRPHLPRCAGRSTRRR